MVVVAVDAATSIVAGFNQQFSLLKQGIQVVENTSGSRFLKNADIAERKENSISVPWVPPVSVEEYTQPIQYLYQEDRKKDRPPQIHSFGSWHAARNRYR